MAPLRSDRFCRARPAPRRMVFWVPRPSQVGQAPCGLLNENSRGSISEMVKPETGQANFSENSMRSWVSFNDLLASRRPRFPRPAAACRQIRRCQSRRQAEAGLEGCRQAGGDVGAHDDAVHDDVDVVLVFLVERRHIGDLVELAVDLDPLKPFFINSASSLRYSPLRPRTMGASR
jgi:hypothetical protein